VYEEVYPKQDTSHWVVQKYVKQCKGIEFQKPMLCSGTTIGTRDAILKYLNIMYEEMKLWMVNTKCIFQDDIADDQAMHNYLFYTNKLPFAKAFKHRTGIVNTIGVEASEIFRDHEQKRKKHPKKYRKKYPGSSDKSWIGTHYNLTDEEGYFINLDGSRSICVHQYDRFGENIDSWLEKNIVLN